MIRAKVTVRLKQSVVDPQGSAVTRSLHALGFDTVADVRVGRLIEVTVDTDDPAEAHDRVQAMCDTLLANPVIETYGVELVAGRDTVGAAP